MSANAPFKMATGGQYGGRRRKDGSRRAPSNRPPRLLADLGISKRLARRARAIAALPEPLFERFLAEGYSETRMEREGRRMITLTVRGEKLSDEGEATS